RLEQLTIAVATCSNFPFGFFNAYEDIANDASIDVVVHLGDYIYEYSQFGYGGEAGKSIGRMHEPAHEIVSLADYRQRHAQYKSDVGSRAMHARHPLIAIWDDHETANNPWMGGAQNHQADEGSWQARRSASMTAYYEWMPIRTPEVGAPRENYWRHFKFGDLVSLITLESRHTGRDVQIDYGDLTRFDSASDAQAFYADVVGAPERNFLSAEMESFLSTELGESVESGRRWRVIGNQSILAKMITPSLQAPLFAGLRDKLDNYTRRLLDTLTQLGEFGVPDDLDSWSGYPAARERFFETSQNAGASDLLVLSGDSHSYWANTLQNDRGESMGVELGSTGITSPSSRLAFGDEGVHEFDKLNQATNQDIVWTDSRHRGYIRLELNHQEAKADFIAISNVVTREYESRIVHTERIDNSDGALRYL
ncbi:MAG: alkaline phosphatase D family protein, partial [Woeseiales bacterium]